MKFTLALAALLTSFSAFALVNPTDASSQYKPYPAEGIPAQTPAPDGYVPFHMEHYGRHGSRWLMEDKNYDVPVMELSKAQRAGVLTPKGEKLLNELRVIQADSKGRLGELTPLGAEQHRGIARRMVANYPTLFAPGTAIDARSTVVIRCILSMLNEIEALSEAVPGLTVTTDASQRDMWYMNHHDPVKNHATDSVRDNVLNPWRQSHANKGAYLASLISDPVFARDSINRPELFDQLFEVALNIPSHGGKYPAILTEVFSPEEIDEGWQLNNANWFLLGANTALNGGLSPTVQRHLLRNMLMSADTAAVSPRQSVNMRFGHETMVLSLAVLLELGDYGKEYNDFETLADHWQAYEIFPMACNIQMVFYRPEGSLNPDDVLVKVMLNEREMPVSFLTPVAGPYYKWTDLRDATLRRLSTRD